MDFAILFGPGFIPIAILYLKKFNMLIALGNGEELRHLNHQEDRLKTVVASENGLFKHNECRWH